MEGKLHESEATIKVSVNSADLDAVTEYINEHHRLINELQDNLNKLYKYHITPTVTVQEI